VYYCHIVYCCERPRYDLHLLCYILFSILTFLNSVFYIRGLYNLQRCRMHLVSKHDKWESLLPARQTTWLCLWQYWRYLSYVSYSLPLWLSSFLCALIVSSQPAMYSPIATLAYAGTIAAVRGVPTNLNAYQPVINQHAMFLRRIIA
jgi:hypothetical protein